MEQYARSVGLAGSVRPALAAADSGATNFAVGAARAYDDGVNFNLGQQVDTFFHRSGGVASPHALFVIEMGGNDIRDAFLLYATGGDGAPVLAQALGSIAANVQRLYAAGARDFLVWVAPNVGLTPAIGSLGPVAQDVAATVSQGFNAGLSGVLAQLAAALPGVNFARLDAYQLLTAIVDDPPAFGLTTATTACVTPNVAPFTCRDADQYLFWDGIHPTRAGHAILAQATQDALQ